MRTTLLASLTLAVLVTSLAACTADLESGCLGGTCETPAATSSSASTTGSGGAGGSDEGGAGGSGEGGAGGGAACLACLPDVGTQTGVLPCDVQQVLVDKCQRCHTDPPANNAPFPLLAYASTQADYGGAPLFVAMHTQIHGGFMPLTPPKLTVAEKQTMLDWLCACAPPAPDGTTCP